MSRVALVTGASRNIGRAIALALARDGWAVACFGRDGGALESTAQRVAQAGSTASVHVGDVATDGATESFVAEAADRHGVPNAASYCASKAGVEGLTRALAAEWARDKISVVGVAPGYVTSDISRDALADPVMAKRIISRIPLRRVGLEEIGGIVAFLASSRAGFITGETFVVDGGQRMSV